MTTRPSRSSSIPIPRSSSSTSPSRNIESVISIPFSAGVTRPRLASGQGFPQRSSVADDFRGHGVSHGVRSSNSVTNNSAIRPTSRSFTHASTMASRGPPSTFEPRVIRADSSRGVDNPCLPSSSTSPNRARRVSTSGIRAPSSQRHSMSLAATAAVSPPSSFSRPAYLEHSSLRHLLQTELTPILPPVRLGGDSSSSSGRPTSTSLTDSDDDSNVSPPRDVAPTSPLWQDPIIRLPTRWSDQYRHPSLSVSADGRDLTFHGQSCSGEKDAASARTNHPAPAACGVYYYEVEIVSKGQKGHISIGFAVNDAKLTRLPGWEKNSWGYHGDDGSCFASERNGVPYGPKFETGDIIGCGVDFTVNRVFYTRNGNHLGLVFEGVGRDNEIYPSVGMRLAGEAIRVNFGQDPFKFDIEYHVLQQRNATWSKIMSTPLDSSLVDGCGRVASKDSITRQKAPVAEEEIKGPLSKLVLSYLAHHGYGRTVRAFRAQCEGRGGIDGRTDTASQPLEDHDMETDEVLRPEVSGPESDGTVMQDRDMELRTRIMTSVIAGDIDTALTEMRKHYPTALQAEEGLILCKLRCRKFVELILEAAEMKKKMKSEENMTVEEAEEDDKPSGVVDGMDIDDDATLLTPSINTNGFGSTAAIPVPGKRKYSPGRSTAGTAAVQYETALTKAIQYGQTLQKDYKSDRRPEVQAISKRTFGIVAWVDPKEVGGETAEVVGQEARITLADDLNQAILKSQGRPAHPALEMLYRQTAACIIQLGLSGVGAAAFADMHKEFLDV